MQPVLILDGHGSRMRLPFLKYINDPTHPWVVCLGVPYGTHIWQVADSSKLNGSFKIALNRAKAKYFSHKAPDNQRFVPTDIIPLISMAWDKSFNRQKIAQAAILDRGWYPLTYCLLDHSRLRRSIVDDKQQSTNTKTNETVNVTKSEDSTMIIFQFNNTQQAMSHMLDKLIAEQTKSFARKC
jgi:hypothetical protein